MGNQIPMTVGDRVDDLSAYPTHVLYVDSFPLLLLQVLVQRDTLAVFEDQVRLQLQAQNLTTTYLAVLVVESFKFDDVGMNQKVEQFGFASRSGPSGFRLADFQSKLPSITFPYDFFHHRKGPLPKLLSNLIFGSQRENGRGVIRTAFKAQGLDEFQIPCLFSRFEVLGLGSLCNGIFS